MATLGDVALPQSGGSRWCRWCGQKVTVSGGDPDFGKAVHTVTGLELGPDGHLVGPVDTEPPLWAAARRIAADYRGAFTVEARFGFLRADWTEAAVGTQETAPHFEDDTETGMRLKLDRAVAGTRWAREGANR